MSYTLPIVPCTTFIERQGVHHVGWTASQMGLVWREVTNTDLGIDGYLEVIVNGAPIGLIAVQVKSGLSYIESSTETGFVFRAESRHVRYWLSYRLPVIVVVYDPEAQVAYWHYIQDYFKEHDEGPSAEKVPIRFSRSNVFNENAKDRLTEIAASPDSTAHAMLALRASRYRYTRELLTQIEMVELYGKRKWLGEWLPLDKDREQILIHTALAGRGPGWFWFRPGTGRDYIPHLKSALKHPDSLLRSEAALALAAAMGQQAVSDLVELLSRDSNSSIFEATRALATISNLTPDDRRQIVEACWDNLQQISGSWPASNSHELLSLIAQIGGVEARQRVVNYYCPTSQLEEYQPQTYPIAPRLLRTAGYLWSKDELSGVRNLLASSRPKMRALAIAALARLGERQDLNPILDYIITPQWLGHEDDRFWLSQQVARLFDVRDLDWLRKMLRSGYNSECVAHPALSSLCRRLDDGTLIGMLNDPMPTFVEYAVRGLVATGKPELLAEYEHLLDSHDHMLSRTISMGLAASGNWEVIERLMQSETYGLREAVAEGLRHVYDKRVFDYLFALLRDDDARLKAGESLAIVGDEDVLHRLVGWLIKHPYEPSTDVATDVLIHLDRRLYCPVQWSVNMERDFSARRYSVRRYEQ